MKRHLLLISCACVLALASVAQTYTPVAVTGFNWDAIAENYPSASYTTGAIDRQSHVMYDVDYGNIVGSGLGLPDNGTIVNGTSTYQLQPYNGNNIIYLTGGQTDSLLLTTPATFTSISILIFATETQSTNDVTLEFTDGTVATYTNVAINDWFNGTPYVIYGFDRTSIATDQPDYNTINPRMYALNYTLSCADQLKLLKTIVFSNISASFQRTCVLALSGAGTPTFTFANTNPICAGSNDGSAQVTVHNGDGAALSYAWSSTPVQTTNPATNLVAGPYVVSVTQGGCVFTANDTLTSGNSTITATLTAHPDSVCAGSSAVLVATGGTTYTWSAGTPVDSADRVTPGATTTYTVSVSNSAGCSATESVVVVVKPIPPAPTISASGPTTFCQGDSVILSSSAASGDIWSSGQAAPSVTVYATGSFTVIDTVDGCVSPASAPQAVTVNPTPVPPVITGGPDTFCQGGSVVLTSSVATGNTWSTGATTQSITVTTSGAYYVTQTVAGCTSPPSDTANVLVNPIPPAPVISGGPDTFCQGGSVVLTSSAPSGNLWSNASTSASITVTASGTFTVTQTLLGCTSPASAPVTVLVNPTPPTPTISGSPLTFCQGDSVILTSSASTGNLWSNADTTQSITVMASGTFTVTQTLLGCTSASSAPVVVTVNPIPPAPVITGGPDTFCQGGSVVLTSSAPSGNVWSNAGTTASITVTTSGTFTVTQTLLGCTSPVSAPVAVFVKPIPPAPTISGSPLTFCQGDSVILTSSATTGNLWNNSDTTQSITVSASGSFSVTQTQLGCTSPPSAPAVVTVNPIPPVPVITASGPTAICAGTSVTLTSSASSGDLWSDGETTPSITLSTADTFTVTQTLLGCTSPVSAPVIVTVIPLPQPLIVTSATTICPGGNPITLDATTPGATAYIWNTNSDQAQLSIDSPGIYSVTVTVNTCTGSDTVDILAKPLLGPLSIPDSSILCTGDSVTIDATTLNATSYRWSGLSDTTPLVTLHADGAYEVTVSNSCGSETAATIVVVRDCNCNMYVPNAFTPNGNGVNDYFRVYYDCPGIKYLLVRVYDRWGEQVYESNDLDGQWDGTFKGVSMEPGVYAYSVDLTGYEGSVSHSFHLKGTLTLIR